MATQSTLQEELGKFSRVIALLFNRATMYHMSHPYVKVTTDEFHMATEKILTDISPLVFILNREQLYIDEEALDSRANVHRIVGHFKKAGIQSISFERGLSKNEITAFLEVYTSLEAYPDADAMKKALVVKGVRHVKINHVIFKKVTEGDEVVSHDALKNLTPEFTDEDQLKSKKLFVDLVLESLLAEELRETLTVENLLKNPAALSKKMTETDLASSKSGEVEGGHPGMVLIHELEMLGEQVGKNLLEDTDANLPELATALLEMKRRLMEGMEAQKSLNITYSNEQLIVDKVNEITDNVLLQIIKDEHKSGKTSISRLAQIVRRLVPEPSELKRLLPNIRALLLDEGMSLAEYLSFVQELGKELQSEELANLLQESAEEIGVDGETLIEEIRKNPLQAAELIFLAAEIRKGAGDEQALTDLLVDYVERFGSKLPMDIDKGNEAEGEQHLRQIITSIESGIVGQLKNMDVKDDLLLRLEERFNDRIDDILERVKLDWIQSRAGQSEKETRKELSVLELMEQSVVEGDDLAEILDVVRARVQAGEMDENDFAGIYAEITKQQAILSREIKSKMPEGILMAPILTLLIEKEIARAKRYDIPFSVISFSLVKVVPKSVDPPRKISYHGLMAAVFQTISTGLRGSDVVGEFGRNRIAALLPMTSDIQAQLALRRCLRLLHASSVDVEGTSLTLRLAGVATTFDPVQTPDASTFLQVLTNDLVQMERRIKNLQTYF